MEINGKACPLNSIKEEVKIPERICVLRNVRQCVQEKLGLQGVNYLSSDESSAFSFLNNNLRTLYILEDFEGELFQAISANKNNWILGSPAVEELLDGNRPIVPRKNNVYCLSMDGLIFGLSIRNKEIGLKTAKLIRYMGGSIRKENRDITYLIATSSLSRSYDYATTFLIPILTPQWVEAAWEKRHIPGFKAANEEMIAQFRLKPFSGLFISFFGFPASESPHLETLVEENGGTKVDLGDSRCTHVVVYSNETNCAESLANLKKEIFVMPSEWFYRSIELKEKLAERFHKLKNESGRLFHDNKQHNENKNEFLPFEMNETDTIKRRRPNDDEIENETKNELCGCVADVKTTDTKDSVVEGTSEICDWNAESNFRSRGCSIDGYDVDHPCVNEFIETEQRYVDILKVILQIFYLSTEMAKNGGPLINKAEAKIIFINIEGILRIHKKILDDVTSAKKKAAILPNLFIKYEGDLMRLYPVFSNGFEESQKMLQECSDAKPDFKKFLKAWQDVPEAGRQHLRELLIRPIQRLGSISLLLKEIYRTTPEGSQYRKNIQAALDSVHNIMDSMNTDKERTIQLCTLFDVYKCIIDCPADLLSSHRILLVKFMAEELTGDLAAVGDYLVFFLFTDIMEVCHIRKKVKPLVLAGENEEQYLKITDGKPYKHHLTISLSDIRRVIDIKDKNNVKDAFAFVHRKDNEIREKNYCFRYLNNNEVTKSEMLRKAALCVAQINMSQNLETYFASLLPNEVDRRLTTLDMRKNVCNVIKSLF